MGVHDDGTGSAIYVAGGFQTAGHVLADGIARFDGVSWSTVGAGWAGLDGLATSMATFDDGAGPVLYVGGAFWSGGVPYGLARWDGTAWSVLGAMTSATNLFLSVASLAVFDDGTGAALYVGGTFTSIGGLLAPGLARWNGTSWSTVGASLTWSFNGPQVLALLVHDDGAGPALFAAGRFDAAGGTFLNGIGRWNGVTWSSLGVGIYGGVVGVAALAEFDDGGGPKLYVGGVFSGAGAVIANGIARWDGSSWSAVGAGVGGGSIASMVSWTDGNASALYLVGSFDSAGGSTGFDGIARWDGTSFAPLGLGIQGSGTSLTTFLHNSTAYLVCGGGFQYAGATGARGVALWNGLAWQSMGGGMGKSLGSPVLLPWNDGTGPSLFAGGDFRTSSAFPIGAGRWNGTSWSSFHTGLSPATPTSPSGIRDLVTFDAGTGVKLFGAGRFYFPPGSGSVPTGIASWDGSLWTSSGFQAQEATALAVHDDGTGAALYGAGPSGGGAGVFKWTGASWTLIGVFFNPTQTVVHTMLSFDDGTGPALYAGGDFSFVGNVPASAIARWNGTTWSPVGGGMAASDFLPTVRALHAHDDGSGLHLFAAGTFQRSGLASTRNIAAWDGTTWQGVGGGLAGSVHGGAPFLAGNALLSFDDGTGSALYVGGRFLTAGSVSASGIARWDGVNWNALGGGLQGPTFDASVEGLAAFNDAMGSSLFCSGDMGIAGGVPSEGIARWTSHVPALFVRQPLGAGTGVFVTNTGLDQGAEVFNLFSLDTCATGLGTGPYFGLCAVNPAVLASQVLTPAGSLPFHYFASTGSATLGPYALPTGLMLEGVCVKWNGVTITGVSPARRFTTQ